MTFLGAIVRFIVSALVLMVVGMFVPGFSTLTFGAALLAAVVIAALGWLVEMLFGQRIAPYGRGIIGFISGVVVIYLAGMIVPGFRVTLFGAIVAALIIGLIDLFIPGDVKGNVMGGRRGVQRRDED